MVQVERRSQAPPRQRRDYSPLAQKLLRLPCRTGSRRSRRRSGAAGPRSSVKDAGGVLPRLVESRASSARYAAAGEAEYPLPLYVNVALRDPFHPGAPEAMRVADPPTMCWKYGRPPRRQLDMCPTSTCTSTRRSTRRCWISISVPTMRCLWRDRRSSQAYARYFLTALGAGLVFSPFGMDFAGYGNYPLGLLKVNPETVRPWPRQLRVGATHAAEAGGAALAGAALSGDRAAHCADNGYVGSWHTTDYVSGCPVRPAKMCRATRSRWAM